MVEEMLDMLDSIEAAEAERLAEVLAATMDDMASRLRTEYTIQSISPPFRRSITEQLSRIWSSTIVNVMSMMQDEFKDAFTALETKAEHDAVHERIFNGYVSRYGARQAAQIIRTTEVQLRDLVRGGMSQGEAAETVFSSVINRIPKLAGVRGLLITRTESHAASQYASQKMAERSSVPLNKIWNTSGDARVRDFGFSGRVSDFNHRIMQGTTVGLYEAFQVPTITGGVENLRFIGDPAGSAGNIINCRCIQTYRRKD